MDELKSVLTEIETQICDIYELQKGLHLALSETKNAVGASILDILDAINASPQNSEAALLKIRQTLALAKDLNKKIDDSITQKFDERIDLVLSNVDKIKALK